MGFLFSGTHLCVCVCVCVCNCIYINIFCGLIKLCISNILNVLLESPQNGCLNTIMNGTAFFLPCNSDSIFSG